jgi:hypothetical protein
MQHISPPWLRHVALALLLTTLLAACSSPEDGRARGGGPGADVGNKSAQFTPESKVFRPSTPPNKAEGVVHEGVIIAPPERYCSPVACFW